MSGSSLDGMDMALLRFSPKPNTPIPEFAWINTGHFSYPQHWIDTLKEIHRLPVADWMQADVAFAQYVAEELQSRGHWLSSTDVIAWHGHTSAHHPDQGWTLALGNGQTLATNLETPVIAEFRRKDVAQGGQGAPLAPLVDAHFFPEIDIAINLGGIVNMTKMDSAKAAFDLAGCNQLLNRIARTLGAPMDKDGVWAASGTIDADLLHALNNWSYLSASPPKSLDNQTVTDFYSPLLASSTLSPKDKLATAVEHIADVILAHLQQNKKQQILLSGGGARNIFLVRRLREKAPRHHWMVAPDPWLDYKEAFLMAYMGYLFMRKENNVFSSWTGGKSDHCAGMLYNP